MKTLSLIILAMLLITPALVSAGENHITSVKIEDLVYQFNYTVENATDYRWSFGDGATSIEVSPVHEFPNHQTYKIVCEVSFADGSTQSDELMLEVNNPMLDTETGTANVGDYSVPGGLLFVMSFMMFALVKTDNHIGSDILDVCGQDGKRLMSFLYVLGMVLGLYLIFTSRYPGVL